MGLNHWVISDSLYERSFLEVVKQMPTERPKIKNHLRPLMRIPVAWLFVLAYLAGVAFEHVFPFALSWKVPRNIGLAGGLCSPLAQCSQDGPGL